MSGYKGRRKPPLFISTRHRVHLHHIRDIAMWPWPIISLAAPAEEGVCFRARVAPLYGAQAALLVVELDHIPPQT